MTYAPATYTAPQRVRAAVVDRPRRRARLWVWWTTPYNDAQVRRAGYALLLIGVAFLAFVAGVVWAMNARADLTTIQQAVAL